MDSAADSKQTIKGVNDNGSTTDTQSVVESLDTKTPISTSSHRDGALTNQGVSSSSFELPNAISPRDHPHPFFYHIHNTKHPFKLHSPPTQSTHSTTLSFIVLIHLLYLYQWNRRLSRSDVSTNYDQLVNKRQYWRGLLAIISHPPVEGGERDIVVNDNNSHGSDDDNSQLNRDTSNNNATRRFVAAWIICNRIKSLLRTIYSPFQVFARRMFYPLIFGHLSGLPLLAFVSHILWQCRALEEVYSVQGGKLILEVENEEKAVKFDNIASHVVSLGSSDDYKTMLQNEDKISSYFCVLIALATTSILLEISLLRIILRRMDQHMDFSGYSTTPRTLLTRCAICSLTSLSAAVLLVYVAMFPYAPTPLLPFIKVSFLSTSRFTLFFSIVILCILSYRIHPVTSVVSGLLSGSLWTLGVTSFLGTRYWGNVMIFILTGALMLSLKSNPTCSVYLKMALPCLDYVAWDEEGDIQESNIRGWTLRFGGSRRESNLDELEMGLTSFSDSNNSAAVATSQQLSTAVERHPLLSYANESGLSESSAIHGRVPFINSMESDLYDGASNPSNTGMMSDGNLSRRNRVV